MKPTNALGVEPKPWNPMCLRRQRTFTKVSNIAYEILVTVNCCGVSIIKIECPFFSFWKSFFASVFPTNFVFIKIKRRLKFS